MSVRNLEKPTLSGPVNEPGIQFGNPSASPHAAASSIIDALGSASREPATRRSVAVVRDPVTRRA